MTFKQGLLNARHHLVFILAVAIAFGFATYTESKVVNYQQRLAIEPNPDIPAALLSPLTTEEKQWAETAWKYFENNYQSETGLVNSVDAYQATTMWDTASYLMALISALKLEIIDQTTFDTRMEKALHGLTRIPLFENQLPNKSYNTKTLAMVDYENNVSEKGIGWSAIDIGRLMVPFNILVWQFPEHTKAVNAVIDKWDLTVMVRNGILYGAAVDKEGNISYVQEGRVGYEEYAAKSIALTGRDLSVALAYEDFISFEDIEGIMIPTDSRDPAVYHAHNYVVSESYVLDGLEFGWDMLSREFAYRVYRAQEERYKRTGILTAVSEDNIDQAPYFVYNTVFTNGKEWNAITDTGADASQFKTLSTKAAFGWNMLYKTDYTELLLDDAGTLFDKDRGFYSGRYEKTGLPNKAITANTNGIILESLHFRVFGPFLRIGGKQNAG